MKAYSLKKAKEIVRAFNVARTAEAAALELHLPIRDVKDIVTWLDTFDPCNQGRETSDKPHTLAIPTSRVWLLWLYEHEFSPRTASACVCAPYQRVLESCGGEAEWLKTCGRRSVATPRKKDRVRMERDPDDPTPEQILALTSELRETWTTHRLLANERASRITPQTTELTDN